MIIPVHIKYDMTHVILYSYYINWFQVWKWLESVFTVNSKYKNNKPSTKVIYLHDLMYLMSAPCLSFRPVNMFCKWFKINIYHVVNSVALCPTGDEEDKWSELSKY